MTDKLPFPPMFTVFVVVTAVVNYRCCLCWLRGKSLDFRCQQILDVRKRQNDLFFALSVKICVGGVNSLETYSLSSDTVTVSVITKNAC